ncbi:MAG: hypothetical protein II161_00535 [Erysipelotrichaceae bacterium]|nr:hypothetical protein [Erysipelotrichaceae bacterium]MBQ4252441.1 hypothetical protein [Erysipelotrichaceae bacterium]
MRNGLREFLPMIVMFILLVFLAPIIGKLIVVALIAFVIFLIYIYFASKKTRAEIERDPEAYFSQSFQQPREKEAIRSDAIDAEYTEKVIDSE